MSRWLPLSFEYLAGWQVAGLYLFLVAFTLLLASRSRVGSEPFRKWAAVGLRLDLFLFLSLLAGGATYVRVAKDLTVVFVRDVSRSIDNANGPMGRDVRQSVSRYVQDQIRRKPLSDRTGIVSFDELARVERLPSTVTTPAALSVGNSDTANGTDPARAIRLAIATLPPDTMSRLVLFWDGNSTGGDLDAALDSAAARRIPIDVVPIRYEVRREIMIDRVVAPPLKSRGQPLTIDVLIDSANQQSAYAQLSLEDNGVPLDMDAAAEGVQISRRITLLPGKNVEHVSIASVSPGAHAFRARVEGALGVDDTLTENNAGEAVTLVSGQGRILLAAGGVESESAPLAAALRRGGLDVVEVSVDRFPDSPLSLQEFDALILSNVPKGVDGLSDAQDQMLASDVKDFGGGLVMIGGPQGLGAGGWIGSKLETVLPVECQPPARKLMPAGALVLVIDHSGSMSGTLANSTRSKQEIANAAAAAAVEALTADDMVGVIAFDSRPTWASPLQANGRRERTLQSLAEISPAGGTDICPALVEAFEALSAVPRDKASVKHVLLLTDGQSQNGDYADIAKKMRAAGITLSTIGVGDDADGALLARLAAMGGGRFYPVRDPLNLPKLFIKEARTLRGTLIRERLFTPLVLDGTVPALSGIEALPPLRGIVSTWAKPAPTVQTPIVSDLREPVLALWHIGLGQSAVFTSDSGARWSGAWVGAPVFDKFWTQLARSVARPSTDGQASARVVSAGADRAKIIVETPSDAGGFTSFLNVTATLLPPGETKGEPIKVRLAQRGPGEYDGEFEATRAGAYVGVVRVRAPAGQEGMIPVAYVVDASAELRELKSNEAELTSVATRTGGRLLSPFDPAPSFFEHANLERRLVRLPLTDYLIYASLVTVLFDVAVRRIAWDAETLRKSRHVALALFAPSAARRRQADDAHRSVDALRETRHRTHEQATAPIVAGADEFLPNSDSALPMQSGSDPVRDSDAHDARSDDQPSKTTMERLVGAKRRASRDREQSHDKTS